MKILVVRNDKIGDLVVTLPSLYLLRQALPDAQIDMLVAPVNKSLVEVCPFIDNAIIDAGSENSLVTRLRNEKYDAVMCHHTIWRNARILWLAGIPIRQGRTGRWFSRFFTLTTEVNPPRIEPYWSSGLNFTDEFVKALGRTPAEHKVPVPLWDISSQREQWRSPFTVNNPDTKLIFLHAGTGGSALTLSNAQYVDFFKRLLQGANTPFKVVLTYGTEELVNTKKLLHDLQKTGIDTVLAPFYASVGEFAESLVAADLFIACSTGPLHLASIHNVATVGFYAAGRMISWQNLCSDERRLAFEPPMGKTRKERRDMSRLDIAHAASETVKLLNQLVTT